MFICRHPLKNKNDSWTNNTTINYTNTKYMIITLVTNIYIYRRPSKIKYNLIML